MNECSCYFKEMCITCGDCKNCSHANREQCYIHELISYCNCICDPTTEQYEIIRKSRHALCGSLCCESDEQYKNFIDINIGNKSEQKVIHELLDKIPGQLEIGDKE